jgi:hypothetical protein
MKAIHATLKRLIKRSTLPVLAGLLVGCSTTGQPTASAGDGSRVHPQQLKFQLASGVYRCELGRRVEIQRDVRNANLIGLNWKGTDFQLQRYDSASGLPRYEDRQHGLLWIDLPQKSVLIDVNSGQQLANECKVARG